MLDSFGEDLFQSYTEGIKVGNLCFRIVVLGLKADCKLQARAGRFTRWYTTCKKSRNPFMIQTKKNKPLVTAVGFALLVISTTLLSL